MACETNIAGTRYQDTGNGWFTFNGATVGAAISNSHAAMAPATPGGVITKNTIKSGSTKTTSAASNLKD